MRKLVFFTVFIVVLLTVALIAQAQTTSAFASDFNWCNSGQPWGDGRCDNSGDPALVNCHWEMGWYLPRVFAGEFGFEDIKSSCLVMIKLVDEIPAGGLIIPVCGRYLVVVLTGSPYLGAADVNVAGDIFDGSAFAECLIIHGNNNDNLLIGSAGHDFIYGYGGDDDIFGDTMSGNGYGNDYIDGGDGDDWIYGDTMCGDGYGNDILIGGAGFDQITGDTECGNGYGNDFIDGGDDDDMLVGDSVYGDGYGNDTIIGGAGSDLIVGDTFFGNGTGNDTIMGGDGDDILAGDSAIGTGSGNDTVDGGAGSDVYAGPGNTGDTLIDIEADGSTPDN